MNFSISIQDQAEMQRLIRTIAREVIDEVQPNKSPIMTKNEAYKKIGRALVDRGISKGTLKLHSIEGRVVIKTKEFENWIESTK